MCVYTLEPGSDTAFLFKLLKQIELRGQRGIHRMETGLSWAWGCLPRHRTKEKTIITHPTPLSAWKVIPACPKVWSNTRARERRKDLGCSLNRMFSPDSVFSWRGRKNQVTLLGLLAMDSSSSCLQGGIREPSHASVPRSLTTPPATQRSLQPW